MQLLPIVRYKHLKLIEMKTITGKCENPWYLRTGKKWDLKTEIKPARYVWHVTHKDIGRFERHRLNNFELREQIRAEGLICRSDWAVFANNGLGKAQDLFPFCLDFYRPFRTPLPKVMKCVMTNYDFWRIDTNAFRGKWYIDPVMSKEIDEFNRRSERLKKTSFICTREHIPNWALKLYTFDKDGVEDIWSNKVVINEGSANIIRIHWTDNLIEHNWNKKTITESLEIAA
jgi:hypothetical protein